MWIARNKSIFQDKLSSSDRVATHVIVIFSLLPPLDSAHDPRNILVEVIDTSSPWAYFNGASLTIGDCGGGAMSYLQKHHLFKLHISLGRGSNDFVE